MLKRLPTFSWPRLACGLALIVAIDAGYYGLAARTWLWDHSGDSLRVSAMRCASLARMDFRRKSLFQLGLCNPRAFWGDFSVGKRWESYF